MSLEIMRINDIICLISFQHMPYLVSVCLRRKGWIGEHREVDGGDIHIYKQ